MNTACTRTARQAAQFVCLSLVLCLAAFGQHPQGHVGGAPHGAMPQAPRPQMQPGFRSAPQANRQTRGPEPSGRPSGNVQGRPGSAYYAPGVPGAGANRAPQARPEYGGSPYAVRPNPRVPGHLPEWMAQHQNLPIGQQDRLLRQEPGFNRLSPGDQQRQIQELHRLNQMPEAQRERRLGRAEAFERLSPGEQMQVRQSAREEQNLSPDRRAVIRRAFQDLRGVPMDQRQIILNSARYSATFSPQERGILSNLLRIEPYQPAH
ncbi:DUF3106 domain-containing protein [Acidicapsa dinghuensis]|uniref:DUF3106 domain-containing protein n=1 Tax=Acidicapsa dinghuensis TaxID=2218256 RepID=A0ABW1ELW0_9BACT|nr:DUF3106 domain-containing protein [Acidicapsa dinghuensis]